MIYMGYGGPPFGVQLVFVLQFIGIMIFLQPLMQLALPPSVSAQFYNPTNGIVNGTFIAYKANFESPVLTQANSTSGFNAISISGLGNFGGLAFMYGEFYQLWISVTNFPKLIYLIFIGMLYDLTLLPYAIGVLLSILAFSYILVSDLFKFISLIQKNDFENVGN